MKIICILLTVLCIGCSKPGAREARLRGSVKELGQKVVTMTYDGYTSSIFGNRDIKITPDSAGYFEIAVPLDAPAYYTIGQNLLLLCPGDGIEAVIARAPANSVFTGQGSEACEYLKGYRWSDTRNMGYGFGDSPPFAELQAKADSIEQVRRTQLAALGGADGQFRARESARLTADRINLWFGNIYKTEFYKWDDTPEAREQKKLDYYTSIAPDIEPMLALIDRDGKLLDVSSVREVLLECYDSGRLAMHATPLLKELSAVAKVAGDMDNGITKANHARFADYANTISDAGIKVAYEAKLAARSRLMEGQPAINVELRDRHGNISKLSDHKGKPLFIDFWATWCLPCLAQSPRFKELSEQYPEIEFVAVSIDQDEEKWRKKVESDGDHAAISEYIADAYSIADKWDVTSIPRFLMIDADFNIVTAFAPRPSDAAKVIPMLDRLAGRVNTQPQ